MTDRAPQAPRRRQWHQWVLLTVTTTGLLGTLLMVQAFANRYDRRADLTPEKRFTLSEHARKVLGDLDRDIEVLAFVRADDPRNREVADLLERVRAASRRVRSSIIDVNRSPAVARQYAVDSYGTIVVQSGDRRRDFSPAREDLLVEAILQVTRPARKVVYFLSGHGEPSITDTDREGGYSAVRMALRTEFYDVQPLTLVGSEGVPRDATVVVIAGPKQDLLTSELLALAQYVERGGALLILADPQSAASLTAFLSRYGVDLRDDVVVDPENRLFAGDYLTMTVPHLAPEHPVTSALKAPPLVSRARSVRFLGPRPGVRGIEFMRTAQTSWRTPDLGVLRSGTAAFADARDQRGPVSVGVAAIVDNPPPTPPGRLIVLGDSDFANNFFLEYLGDRDLVINAVNWLAGQEALVGSRQQRRLPGVNQFFVSARQGRLAFWLGTVLQPAIFLLLGAVVFLRRRWRG